MKNLTFLDRAIGYLFPSWGVSRAWARLSLRSYDAARRDEQGGNWLPPQNASPEMTDAGSRSLVRARARDLERNGTIAEGVVDAIIRNVIGTGFTLEAQVKNTRGRQLDIINDRIEALWKEWSLAENCDITGDSSFAELLEIVARRWDVDGEIFIVRVIDPEASIPLKLQLLESDLLAEDVFECNGRYVFGGVEVDKHMRAVAYHFRPDPMPYFKNMNVVRFPREDVIHIFKKKRAQQTRGISEQAISMESMRHAQEYLNNELEAARTAASLTAIVTKDKGAGGSGIGNLSALRGGKGSGSKLEEIRRNMLNYIGIGEDVKFPQPGRPNINAVSFVNFFIRIIGMGRGLSYETTSRDMSQVNYSSHRGGQLEDRKTFVRKQNQLVQKFCDRVYEWFVEAAVLSGELKMPKFFESPAARKRALCHKWTTPGWKWVDPLKEATAIQLQLSMGITNLSEVCGEQGKDWYEVARQWKEEVKTLKEMGLMLPWFATPAQVLDADNSQLISDEDNPPSKKEGNNAQENEET